MSDQMRRALRNLEEKRSIFNWARAHFVTAVASTFTVVALWVAQLSTDWDGAGYGFKVVGLIILSAATVTWVFATGDHLSGCASERRKAVYAHEDAVLRVYGGDQ